MAGPPSSSGTDRFTELVKRRRRCRGGGRAGDRRPSNLAAEHGPHCQAGREPPTRTPGDPFCSVSAGRGRGSAAAWWVDWLAGDGLRLQIDDLHRNVVVVAEDDADPTGVGIDVPVGGAAAGGTAAPELPLAP